MLWRELQLDQFWSKRLGSSRKGTHWDQVRFVLVAYRLLAPRVKPVGLQDAADNHQAPLIA
jgi:hypothetical protein